MSLAETLLWLCEIPSPIGEEEALCDAVGARLSRTRRAAEIRRYQNSIVVPLTRGTGGPRIALCGHLDVVRTEHDGPPRIEGDRLYGPGAADMKSGLALMVDLAESAARPPADITLVFYAREEGPFEENELGPVLERDPELRATQMAVCLEPSDNRLQLGCAGSVHATIRFSGRTAHSARPWQGENAIHKAAGFLSRLAALTPQPADVEGLVWTASTSATLASGGRGRNIIPDLFEVNVNHRFGPDRTLVQAQEHLQALAGTDAEVAFVDLAPPAKPFRHHPLVDALAQSGVVTIEPKQAWTDVARFSAMGIPAVNFGPGVNAQAHQRNEWTSIQLLEDGRQILNRWLARVAS
jgi:succinyl-diaminopimelate desuccinylase